MLVADTASRITYVLDEPARILVVDDDPIILEFARVYLTTPVVDIQTAGGGAAALEALVSERFDLALVDLEMPGMSGFELIQRIRSVQRLASLPIIVVTGREDVESIDEAFRAGATSFVTKPINWRLLSYQMRYVLRAHAGERAA
ncbi:MAG: response regulator [Rhizobiales bacterium]|nr:response regulator [Hyphomicrobiales bacterium]